VRNRKKNWQRKETDSNITSGKWITRERRATMGKVAAKELLPQMMKREAMRRLLKAVSPPPEPQLGDDMLVGKSRGIRGDYSSYNPARGQRNREGPQMDTFQTRLAVPFPWPN
jgi:hypothetical protein